MLTKTQDQRTCSSSRNISSDPVHSNDSNISSSIDRNNNGNISSGIVRISNGNISSGIARSINGNISSGIVRSINGNLSSAIVRSSNGNMSSGAARNSSGNIYCGIVRSSNDNMYSCNTHVEVALYIIWWEISVGKTHVRSGTIYPLVRDHRTVIKSHALISRDDQATSEQEASFYICIPSVWPVGDKRELLLQLLVNNCRVSFMYIWDMYIVNSFRAVAKFNKKNNSWSDNDMCVH